MRIKEILRENSDKVVGPFKVLDYDPESRTVDVGERRFTLSSEIKDPPRPEHIYAFQIDHGIASRIILLTADIVVTNGAEILLIKRRNNPFAGHWALPGGFVDPGEGPRGAASRELAEETGVRVGPTELHFIGKFSAPYRDPRRQDTWSYAFLAHVSGQPGRAGDDAAALAWVPVDQARDLKLAFDHNEILNRAGLI